MKKFMKLFSAPVALAGAAAGVAVAATSCASSDLVKFKDSTFALTVSGTNASGTFSNEITDWGTFTSIKSARVNGTSEIINDVSTFSASKATTNAAGDLTINLTLKSGKNLDTPVIVTLTITVNDGKADKTFDHTFTFKKA
ncbi:MAG: hypothetical protein L3I91_00035 [Mycoplasma sp.]